MSDEQYAVVITTINSPTRAVDEIEANAPKLSAAFHVIGDSKSPPDFKLEGGRYFDIDAQVATGFRFAALCPTKHYARKNIGYLTAIRDGASIIVETDDDNIPMAGFWDQRVRTVEAPLVSGSTWCNVYSFFTDTQIWPRGLPLDRVRDPVPALSSFASQASDCPIQQGLADGDPDVDAIYRLVLPLPLDFEPGRTVVLDKGVWCPFNSQNTTFWADAFPLLYLPYHCSFRMTDIWRSFVAQRIMWENDWKMMFHSSTVFQERNEHNLMRDFADEVPGYLHNDRIRKTLEDLPIAAGITAIPDNVRMAYKALMDMELVGKEEEALLDAWLTDLHGLPVTSGR
jgi:hypothetical protein